MADASGEFFVYNGAGGLPSQPSRVGVAGWCEIGRQVMLEHVTLVHRAFGSWRRERK
jgi:hypothetical protein